MKKRILIGIVCLILVAVLIPVGVRGGRYLRYLNRKEAVAITPEEGTIKAMSCNVRCITNIDKGVKNWYYRADLLMDDIEGEAPGIIGFQEVTPKQYDYLVDCLPQYESEIVYRDDTKKPEGCPVFYHKDLYEKVEMGSFWLSETPEKMSKDWGAACYRICSYMILKERSTSKEFVIFNTHLDHVSDEARIKGIGVVLDKIKAFGGLPSVIMGDLNAEEGSETYNSVTQNFLDARYVAESTTDSYTYQNWGNMESAKRIDYFMISKEGIKAQRYNVVPALHDGVYSTDHCPITVEFTLK